MASWHQHHQTRSLLDWPITGSYRQPSARGWLLPHYKQGIVAGRNYGNSYLLLSAVGCRPHAQGGYDWAGLEGSDRQRSRTVATKKRRTSGGSNPASRPIEDALLLDHLASFTGSITVKILQNQPSSEDPNIFQNFEHKLRKKLNVLRNALNFQNCEHIF